MADQAEPRPSSEQRQRADARRNRHRLLAAAMEAFAEEGVDAQMSSIARRANLAVGTLYRHFPTKEALVDALLLDRLALVGVAAESAATEPDPWRALEGFIRQVTVLQIEHRALSEFIGGRVRGSPELRLQLRAIFGVFAELVVRAKDSGQLRPDIGADDIRVIVICIARALAWDWPQPAWVLDRYLGVVVDGLRAPGKTCLRESRLSVGPDDPAESSAVPPFRPGKRGWRTSTRPGESCAE
jgi:AcrR family transcriptional regulator